MRVEHFSHVKPFFCCKTTITLHLHQRRSCTTTKSNNFTISVSGIRTYESPFTAHGRVQDWPSRERPGTRLTKEVIFLQNDKSSLFAALEVVRESYILIYSTPHLFQKAESRVANLPWEIELNGMKVVKYCIEVSHWLHWINEYLHLR